MGTLVKRFLKATLAAVLAPAIVHAAMDADLCRVAKMKAGSAYHGCRCKAQATHVKSAGAPADDSKRDAAYLACDTALVGAYGAAESRYGSACPTNGDVDSVLADLSRCTGSGFFSSRLLNIAQRTPYGPGSDGDFQIGASRSLTDGGDGTVTDNRTGLMWEKKSWDGSIHDMGNAYSWGDGYLDGTVTTEFLATLNTPLCFAGYCDWRLPNRLELETLANFDTAMPATFPEFDSSCTPGCTILTCSCTSEGASALQYAHSSSYWSSSVLAIPAYMIPRGWGVNFNSGNDQ
ncbi:MAG: hypothetical protein RL698_2190, partial [Pseudomonadota bacterium]